MKIKLYNFAYSPNLIDIYLITKHIERLFLYYKYHYIAEYKEYNNKYEEICFTTYNKFVSNLSQVCIFVKAKKYIQHSSICLLT